ncbi:phosphotransferase [Leucobacter chinensis]|uniref:phosphotransferase n=1 Tax=Leucobacter chinensis TaxID=2851010 RepID=UPI00350ED184
MPDIDRLVMCHGDACAPNTLIDDAGNFLAHVDLGRVGAADRWADLAVLTMSLAWNYRDYDESIFWRAYGAQPDWTRIDFYRRLWDAT